LDGAPTDDLYLSVALELDSPRALELFHRAFFGFIRDVSRKFSQDADDAEDVAQDICVSMAKRIRAYTGAGSLQGWLARLAPNVTRDRYRTRFRARLRSIEALAEGAADADRAPAPSALSDGGAAAGQVRDRMDRARCREMFDRALPDALDRLDAELRELIEYRYFQGLKGREIALIRGIGETIVSKRIKKALDRLQKRVYMAATTLFNFTSDEVRLCLELIL